MTTIKDNKTFQTIVGAATLYLLFVLWRDGWIDWIVGDREPESGYSNTQLWVAVGSALLSFVQFVGIVTIGCVSGILPHVSSVVEFGAKKASEGISYLKAWVSKNKGKPKEENQWDWRPLVVVVLSYMLWSGGQLSSIWEKVQGLIPDQIITDVERPSAAVFFIDDDTVSSEERAIATSLLVSDIFESKGVERRMMSTDQPSGSSEGWLSTIVEKSPNDRSSLVLYYIDGTSKVLDVPDSVEKVKELVGAW
jgi:hypothetical protein